MYPVYPVDPVFWVWHPGNTNSNLLAVPHQCTIDFHQVDALLHGLKRTGCSTDEVRGWSCFCGIHSMAESQALRNSSSGYAALTETTRTADSRRFLPSRPVLMAWAAPHRWPAIVVLLQALPTALIAENSQLRGVSSWFQETAPSAVLHTRPFSHAQPESPWLSHRKRRPQPKINSGKTARPEKKAPHGFWMIRIGCVAVMRSLTPALQGLFRRPPEQSWAAGFQCKRFSQRTTLIETTRPTYWRYKVTIQLHFEPLSMVQCGIELHDDSTETLVWWWPGFTSNPCNSQEACFRSVILCSHVTVLVILSVSTGQFRNSHWWCLC